MGRKVETPNSTFKRLSHITNHPVTGNSPKLVLHFWTNFTSHEKSHEKIHAAWHAKSVHEIFPALN